MLVFRKIYEEIFIWIPFIKPLKITLGANFQRMEPIRVITFELAFQLKRDLGIPLGA